MAATTAGAGRVSVTTVIRGPNGAVRLRALRPNLFALDATKFGRKALSLTAPFGPRMTVVTDTRPAPPVVAAIVSAGAKLTLAGK